MISTTLVRCLRSPGPDAGGDDGGADVLPHLHLQLLLHDIHDGHLAAGADPALGDGAAGGGPHLRHLPGGRQHRLDPHHPELQLVPALRLHPG